jgi:hypothetical protein
MLIPATAADSKLWRMVYHGGKKEKLLNCEKLRMPWLTLLKRYSSATPKSHCLFIAFEINSFEKYL